MRVVVDAHMVGSHETGNETYIVNLLSNLARLQDVRCAAAVAHDSRLPAVLQDAAIELLPLRPHGNWARLVCTLPSACRRWQADILHVTYVGPLPATCPLVVTVHDVAFKHYPDFFSPRDRLLFATLLPFTLRRASAVITGSMHAKQEILGFYPFLDGKVHVTPDSPGPLFQPIGEKQSLQAIQSRYGIRTEFILAVGNLQPRKNLLRLISAFASIRGQRGPIQLVIAGKAQWQSSAVYAAVRRLGVERDVAFTGYVIDEDLVLLYNAAKVFVYPSIYEGFGLPVLEAMACGTPVVTSNTSSMPEVAGDAALLVDPYQERHIESAIQQILTNSELASSLSRKGLKRAQGFSWHRTAQQTARVYQAVLDGSSPEQA